MKNYYELLAIEASATADEIKKAFRAQIARYHPDKVHHLGKEFQEMAAERAAELTEAYRILSHEGRRAEYDAGRGNGGGPASPVSSTRSATAEPTQRTQHTQHTPQAPQAPHAAPNAHATPGAAPSGATRQEPAGQSSGSQFVGERASRDEFVRKATISRFRKAFEQVAGSGYDESEVRGFDIACVPKSKFLLRGKGPRLLGRFVSLVDSAAVADAWTQAGKWGIQGPGGPGGNEVCVILMGTSLAPPRELADAIAEQRRRPMRGCKVTLIPVDASIWTAHMPLDAPGVAKDLLSRLRGSL